MDAVAGPSNPDEGVHSVDAKDDWLGIAKGGIIVACVGAGAAVVVPSHKLPGASGLINDVLGFTYMAAWSYSFYPQFILNWKRRSVVGLSLDFQMLNLLGFACYAAYNVALFCVPEVQHQYRAHYSDNIPVGLEDVAFSVHALAITTATLLQCFLFERGAQKFLSPIGVTAVVAFAGTAAVVLAAALTGAAVHALSWINVLVLLSTIKLAVSLIKYVPQVALNVRRKSTVGWSIHNVLLDFSGGMLSLVQLLLQCSVQNDWTQISGNPVKFGLGFVSVFFDLIFMLQHYVLYRGHTSGAAQGVADEDEVRLICSEVAHKERSRN